MSPNYLDDLTGEADLDLTGDLDADRSRDLLNTRKKMVRKRWEVWHAFNYFLKEKDEKDRKEKKKGFTPPISSNAAASAAASTLAPGWTAIVSLHLSKWMNK